MFLVRLTPLCKVNKPECTAGSSELGQFWETREASRKGTDQDTYLHAGVPGRKAFRSQAGKKQCHHQCTNQAEGRSHPGIFCNKRRPWESMMSEQQRLAGQSPWGTGFFCLRRCPSASTIFKDVLGQRVRGSESGNFSVLSLFFFILEFICPNVGGSLED